MTNPKYSEIKLFQWNCRSISTNLSYLKHYLVSNNCDILILQSLSCKSSKLPRLPNYYFPPVYNIGKESEKVHTAIYILNSLQYSICRCPDLKSDVDIYMCGATVKFSKSVIINVMSVYLPKGPNDKNTEWIKTVRDQQPGKWFIAGDFNAHAPFWEKDCKFVTSNRLVENIVDSPFHLLNDGSVTRIPDVSKHKATAIDLTLVSPEIVPSCSWETYKDTLGSDHIPIITTISDGHNKDRNITVDIIPKYNYKKANWSLFQTILASQEFERYEDENIDTMYSAFMECVLSAADKAIPRLKEVKSGDRTGNVWWSDSCEKAVTYKQQMFKKYIRNKTPENHVEMKKANIQCNMTVAQAKKDYWTSFCAREISNHKDYHKTWHKIKEMKKGIQLPHCPIQIDSENKFPSDNEKAEVFVKMFAHNSQNVGLSSDCRNFREKEENNPKYTDPRPQNDLWFNSLITFEELTDAIKSISNKKSSVGIDAISNEMLRHIPGKCIDFLHSILKKCWVNGNIPEIWKKSIVIPVLKSGKPKRDIKSYRPIALTSHVSKLMERIVLKRIIRFCEKNCVIPINQAGFRKGRSTVEHLIKLTTHIKQQFARRKNVLATFFDVKKAYDQVWHKRLLYKLSLVGLSGNMYNYIKSFLTNRSIQARVGTNYSSFHSLDMGIPQGSVIAPILFNILIQDLPKALSNRITLAQYADDICMWMGVTLKKSTPQRAKNYIRRLYQLDLDNLGNYMLENGLTLSTEKTKMVLFDTGSKQQNLPVFKIYNDELEYSETVKFLGVFLTSKLTWNSHFDYILTKARKSLNLLKIISRSSWGMDTKTLIHICTALVRSKLTYSQEIYFSAPKYLLKKFKV